MKATIIAAVADNGVIGHQGKIPWNCPEDMQFFKQTTKGHPVIMGRLTFESLQKPLPGRLNVVISRFPYFVEPERNVVWVSSLEEAMALDFKALGWDTDPYIIGGAQIYGKALELGLVSKMLITRIHCSPPGDTYFPDDKNNLKHMRTVPFRAQHPGMPHYTFEEWIWIAG